MKDGKILRPDARKSLAGLQCPMNVVYAKVELAKLAEGEVLELILDEGTPVANVTRSLEREGHALLAGRELAGGRWSLFVRKGSRRR
jgi:TusA-related sulfurtransferase